MSAGWETSPFTEASEALMCQGLWWGMEPTPRSPPRRPPRLELERLVRLDCILGAEPYTPGAGSLRSHIGARPHDGAEPGPAFLLSTSGQGQYGQGTRLRDASFSQNTQSRTMASWCMAAVRKETQVGLCTELCWVPRAALGSRTGSPLPTCCSPKVPAPRERLRLSFLRLIDPTPVRHLTGSRSELDWKATLSVEPAPRDAQRPRGALRGGLGQEKACESQGRRPKAAGWALGPALRS